MNSLLAETIKWEILNWPLNYGHVVSDAGLLTRPNDKLNVIRCIWIDSFAQTEEINETKIFLSTFELVEHALTRWPQSQCSADSFSLFYFAYTNDVRLMVCTVNNNIINFTVAAFIIHHISNNLLSHTYSTWWAWLHDSPHTSRQRRRSLHQNAKYCISEMIDLSIEELRFGPFYVTITVPA